MDGMKHARGQFWVFDMSVATLIFLLALGILLFVRWSVMTGLEDNSETILRDTLKFSDILLSPGEPLNWSAMINESRICNDSSEMEKVDRLGITSEFDNITLDIEKARKLILIAEQPCGYDEIRAKTKLPYDFYIRLLEVNESDVSTPYLDSPLEPSHPFQVAGRNFTIGNLPSGEFNIISIDRLAVYNGTLLRLEIYVWSNESWITK